MDPLVDLLMKDHGMSQDLASRVAQNLRANPDPNGFYAPTVQKADQLAQSGQQIGPAERAAYDQASKPNTSVTSAAIAQQFGIPPQQSAQLAQQLNPPRYSDVKAGVTAAMGYLPGANEGFGQAEAFNRRDRLEAARAQLPGAPSLEIGRATVEKPDQISLEVGPVSVEKPPDPLAELSHLAGYYEGRRTDPMVKAYWSRPENIKSAKQQDAQYLAALRNAMATDPKMARRAVQMGVASENARYAKIRQLRERNGVKVKH